MLFQTSLGIDIGDDLLSVVCLSASVKGFRLAAQGVLLFEREMPLGGRVSLIGPFLRDFMKQHQISPSTVFIGIPRSSAVLRYLHLPVAVRENLRDALGYEMEKYVPFPVEDIYFDFQVIGEDREAGMMRVLLVAVKREIMSPLLAMAEEMAFGISGIEVRSTAVANWFAGRLDGTDPDCSAFVWVDDAGMDVGLLRKGRLDYSREIRFSSPRQDLSDMIAQELAMLRRRMAREDGGLNAVLCAPEGDGLAERLTGGQEWLLVRQADLSQTGLRSCRGVPAYGLALKAFSRVPTDINLLPPRLRKRASRAGYYVMIGLAALLALLLVGWGGGHMLQYRRAVERLDRELKTLSTAVAAIERDREASRRTEKRLEALNALGAGPSVLEVLKELSERIPQSAWIMGFTFSDKGVELEGEAESASELIEILEESPIFSDVVFLSTITKTGEGKDRFRIGLKFG